MAREGQGYPCYQRDMMMTFVCALSKCTVTSTFVVGGYGYFEAIIFLQIVLIFFYYKGQIRIWEFVALLLTCSTGLKVSEFELQSLYYIHFWTSTLRKGMQSLISPTSDWLNIIAAVLQQGWL